MITGKSGICMAGLLVAFMASNAWYATAAPAKNLAIKNIEITQAVQCLDQTQGYTKCPDNALELDISRPVAVRVYLSHDGACSSEYLPFETILKAATVKIYWVARHDFEGPPGSGELLFSAEKVFDVPCTTDLAKLRDDEPRVRRAESVCA